MVIKVNDMDFKVLSIFTKSYSSEYYIREVAKKISISSRTAQLTLSKLEKEGVLESITRGKIKNYTIRNSLIAREYFILVEQYKKISFLKKHLLLKEVLEKTEPYIKGMMILFGSYAKGTQKVNSDVDVLICGKYQEKLINEVADRYGLRIDIKHYPIGVFKKNIHKDILLKEMLDSHTVLKNIELFVRCVFPWIK